MRRELKRWTLAIVLVMWSAGVIAMRFNIPAFSVLFGEWSFVAMLSLLVGGLVFWLFVGLAALKYLSRDDD